MRSKTQQRQILQTDRAPTVQSVDCVS